MAILYFSDVLRKVGIDPIKVKMIRHALTDKRFKACYDANKVFEYTCHQSKKLDQDYEYWATFICLLLLLAYLFVPWRKIFKKVKKYFK